MKKAIISIILAGTLVLSMAACGKKSEVATTTTKTQTATEAVSTKDPEKESTSVIELNKETETSIASWDQEVTYNSITAEEIAEQAADDAENYRKSITGQFTILTENKSGYTVSGSTYTITQEGEYTFQGALVGNVVIDAEDAKVEITLSGCSITSSNAAPITVISADKVNITAAKDTFNEISDNRAVKTVDSDDEVTPENAGAAIFSTCDLTIKGNGAMVVTGNYNNGIGSKDDLEIKNLTLKVTGTNNAIKGNDSVTMDSAQIIAIAASGDGIKTENSDVTKKGNQKGTVSINEGTVNVYAAKDGISAAYDVQLSGSGFLGIYTDTYSSYSMDGIKKSTSEVYLILSQSDYNSGYDYYAYVYNGTDTTAGEFVKGGTSISVSGGRSQYYGMPLNMPSGYDNVVYCAFEKGATASTDNYVWCTDSMTINNNKNAYLISSISGTTADGDWTTLTTGSSGKSGQEYSTKGIKANNQITVEGNISVVICSTDDSIHVNNDVELDNGETGEGNFIQNGGRIKLTTADDGVHAEGNLTINAGILVVTTSYEGLEGANITINGGRTFVYATDDAVNGATSNNTSATVTVNGGYLQVETPSGDTDAIDVNGSYVQNGGFVLVKGGSTMGSVAGSVDVDGSITVDGGCIIACGGICETPSGKANAYASSGTSLSAGDYTVTDGSGNVIASFTLTGNFSGIWIACDDLVTGTDYTLATNGSTLLSWTQEEGTMGSAGGGFGGGGFGGGGFGGGPGGQGGGPGGGGPGGR